MAVTATFLPSNGTLSTFGDNLDNNVAISRNAAGTILVNGGAVAVQGGTPTVANTALIQVFGQAGNDTLALSEVNGALPKANLFGGTGNDVLTGGSGTDMLFGQADNDTLLGKGGNDFLFGGAGNDTLTGGDADDQVFGEAGNDRMIWNPGDDSDLFEGGADIDTAEVNGGNGAENFTMTANGARVRFDRLDPAPFALDIGTTEKAVVNMNGGDDRFSATGNLAALIGVTVDGGTGNDTILGSNGNDLLLGGDGNDFVDGQQGNDVALLGAGDDVAQWDPGDGSDVIEGQAGADTLLFNGSGANETMEVSANGGRVRFTRDVANIVMDLNDVEKLQVNAVGGADRITVNDLSGTDVAEVSVNLAGVIGSTAGDGQADTVTANGTNGNDIIDVFGSGSSVAVVGLSARVNIANSEGANDALVIKAGGGNDGITATTMPAGVVKLTIDAGSGNDTVLGSQGADTILGGDGNDFVFGDNGNDVALLGANDDTFQWDPGDGNDTVEGQDGTDTLLFFGSNASENIDIVANGGRVLFHRDVANVTMDLNDVETIAYRALGGADNVVVGDLSGTDVTKVSVDLRGPNGGADGAADTVTANATNGADVFGVAGDADGVTVFGLQARIDIVETDAGDRLTLNGLGGDDVINASSLEAGAVALTMNGGLGRDLFVGSEGGDLFNGGDGDDTALMGAGDDTFVWNPGDDNDTLEGQAGSDTLAFNGANVSETIDITANGGRVRFFRDVANVTMDLNDVETIAFKALGGADRITINDLSGTDASLISIDLGDAAGNPDASSDTVGVNGTAGADVITIADANGAALVTGLKAAVKVEHADVRTDVLEVLGGFGNDVIDARGASTEPLTLSLVGGEGNDTLVSSAQADILNGGGGLDTASYAASAAAVTVDLATGSTSGGSAQGDALIGIENLIGSGFADTLTGNGGANRLDGLGGADTLRGGLGDDIYIVDDAGDQVVEATGGGADDRVLARDSYVLAAGQDVEVLGTISAADTAAIDLTGNEKGQAIIGNAGVNVLDGGAGIDTMVGLVGNDRYIVDQAGDRVVEAAGGGTDDRVLARDSYALAAGQDIEVLGTISAAGTAAIDLTGNEKSQFLSGNAGANVLDGGLGNDVLTGRGGNDAFLFKTALGSSNVDHITDFSAVADTIELENGIFTGLAAGTLSASAFKDVGVAGASVDADDRVIYDHNTGVLSFDADGSGGAATARQFAVLDNHAVLSFNDVLIV